MAVVGGLASAAQLIDLSTNIVVSLISIYRKAQEAPSRILQYIREVEGLIVTTKFIEDQSDIHQNRVVQSSIQATLVEARELKVVLDRVATDYTKGSTRRKYWKRIKASKESNIRIQFKRLESAKIQLVLCISAQSISTLCAIQSKIDRLLVEFDRQKTFDMLSRKTKSSASTKTKTSQTTEHGSKENNKHGAFQRMLTRLSGSRSERHTPVENQSQALVVMERQEATQGLHKEDPRSAAAEVATIISPLDSRPSGAASVEDGYAQGYAASTTASQQDGRAGDNASYDNSKQVNGFLCTEFRSEDSRNTRRNTSHDNSYQDNGDTVTADNETFLKVAQMKYAIPYPK